MDFELMRLRLGHLVCKKRAVALFGNIVNKVRTLKVSFMTIFMVHTRVWKHAETCLGNSGLACHKS